MTWIKTDAGRKRDAQNYGDPEYKRNRAAVRRRSGGRCEVTENGRQCGSRDRVQCDHIVPLSQGGTHNMENLRDTCAAHHKAKTALEATAARRAAGRAAADPPLTVRTRW